MANIRPGAKKIEPTGLIHININHYLPLTTQSVSKILTDDSKH